MDCVPSDVLVLLASLLDARDVASMLQASKWLYNALGGVDVWRRCCHALNIQPCWYDVDALFRDTSLCGKVLFAWSHLVDRPPPFWGVMYSDVHD
jgi:hypothetical protein